MHGSTAYQVDALAPRRVQHDPKPDQPLHALAQVHPTFLRIGAFVRGTFSLRLPEQMNVQLSEWKAKAKVDFVKIAIPHRETAIERLMNALESGLDVSTACATSSFRETTITTHDPTTAHFASLMETLPEFPIGELEVSIDFFTRDHGNDRRRLTALHRYLAIHLFPQKHRLMRLHVARKFYDPKQGKYVQDRLRTASAETSVLFHNSKNLIQVRCYIKTLDNRKPLKHHSVRVEVTLIGAGLQHDDRHRQIRDLPDLFRSLRKTVAPYFHVTAGIKPTIKRSRATTPEKAEKARRAAENERRRANREFERYGAQWAYRHDHRVVPHAAFNRITGDALSELQRSLTGHFAMEKLEITNNSGQSPTRKTSNGATPA